MHEPTTGMAVRSHSHLVVVTKDQDAAFGAVGDGRFILVPNV